MHHKFAIFDGKVLITGSYNWTDSAECFNYENVLILDDSATIQRYQVQFEQLFNGWKGPTSASPLRGLYGFRHFSAGIGKVVATQVATFS